MGTIAEWDHQAPWLARPHGAHGRLPLAACYATSAEARFTDGFAGARTTSAMPTISNTTTPASSRRSITFQYSCTAITPACARFAHPPKAIRRRFAAGLRTGHVLSTLKPDGTWMIVEPFANDRTEKNHNPVGTNLLLGINDDLHASLSCARGRCGPRCAGW